MYGISATWNWLLPLFTRIKLWNNEHVSPLSRRWEVVASFINQHVEGAQRTAKEVLAHAKTLQKSDQSLKQSANKNAYENFEKSSKAPSKVDDKEISERTESK